MSKRLDILGEAFLPSDLLTPTDASTGLLEGFEDMQYGLGVLEQFKAQGTPPGAGLPDGVIHLSQGPNLKGFMQEASLTDLSWLDLQEQDFERLPKNPHYEAVPELEEAWGMGRTTDGVNFGVDLEQARYEASLHKKPSFKHSAADLTRVVQKAMRRSASGHPLKEIFREAAEALGEEAYRVKAAMRMVAAEHGLAGNVFIRASAYPGYEQGRWEETLRHSKSARYILVDAKTMRAAFVQDGHCTISKKRAVTEIPWTEAYAHYKPLLEGRGVRVASGDARKMLKAAFLAQPQRVQTIESSRPTHVSPVQTVTHKEARRVFEATPVEAQVVYDSLPTIEARKRQAAWQKIQSWVAAGLVPLHQAMDYVRDDISGSEMLRRVASVIVHTKGASAFSGMPNEVRPPEISPEEARKILAGVSVPEAVTATTATRQEVVARAESVQNTLDRWASAGMLTPKMVERLKTSTAPPEKVLKVASALVVASRPRQFSGVYNDHKIASATENEVWSSLKSAEDGVRHTQARVDQHRMAQKMAAVQSKVQKVAAAVERGVSGEALLAMIRRTFNRGEFKAASSQLAELVRKSQAPGKKAQYEGPVYRPVEYKATSPSPREMEVDHMLQWTRQAMSEGYAGKPLEEVLTARFSPSLRELGSTRLAALRNEFEGVSGFVFVEAAAYASPKGTKGCEAGALKHRANQVRHVLAMSRCASCALANSLPDGTRVCQAYNKSLVTASDLPSNLENIRKGNIKAASMSDVEQVSSLFAPRFDQTQFSLHNGALDDIVLDEPAEMERLGQVLFGGLIVDLK